jgi:RNA polymerase sigma-70 factor (ECF subfamily)
VIRPAAQPSPQLAALDDAQVVARVLAGETGLFEILMRRYNQRLYRVARGFAAADEAEDIVQEAYVNAFHKLAGFRGEAPFATWLTKIVVYEAMARSRKGKRFVALDGDAVPEPASERPGPERRAENAELRGLLGAAVAALPAALRPVFVLREIEGLTSEETADILDLTPGNVRVRLHRAKAQLRDWLDDRLGEELRAHYAFDGARCDRLVAAVFARLEGS